MNWSDCVAVETVPGRLSGVPVIVRSRVRPDDLVVNRQEGADWLAENYGLSLDMVQIVLDFHARQMSLATHSL